jgi:DNA-directed RNA polymerase subunit RPC12/RpoP
METKKDDIESKKVCRICGKPIIETPNGLAHANGGIMEQKCNECGWVGGQAEGFVNCPRCGSQVSLVNDHKASE